MNDTTLDSELERVEWSLEVQLKGRLLCFSFHSFELLLPLVLPPIQGC
jgi:hypothetical protein